MPFLLCAGDRGVPPRASRDMDADPRAGAAGHGALPRALVRLEVGCVSQIDEELIDLPAWEDMDPLQRAAYATALSDHDLV